MSMSTTAPVKKKQGLLEEIEDLNRNIEELEEESSKLSFRMELSIVQLASAPSLAAPESDSSAMHGCAECSRSTAVAAIQALYAQIPADFAASQALSSRPPLRTSNREAPRPYVLQTVLNQHAAARMSPRPRDLCPQELKVTLQKLTEYAETQNNEK